MSGDAEPDSKELESSIEQPVDEEAKDVEEAADVGGDEEKRSDNEVEADMSVAQAKRGGGKRSLPAKEELPSLHSSFGALQTSSATVLARTPRLAALARLIVVSRPPSHDQPRRTVRKTSVSSGSVSHRPGGKKPGRSASGDNLRGDELPQASAERPTPTDMALSDPGFERYELSTKALRISRRFVRCSKRQLLEAPVPP